MRIDGFSEPFADYGMYGIQQDGEAVYGLLGPDAVLICCSPPQGRVVLEL